MATVGELVGESPAAHPVLARTDRISDLFYEFGAESRLPGFIPSSGLDDIQLDFRSELDPTALGGKCARTRAFISCSGTAVSGLRR